MSERNSHVPIGNEWMNYGNGVGLKTEDLVAFTEVASERVKVLKGITVGVNYFDEALEISGLDLRSDLDDIDDLKLPESLREVNQRILKSLPQDVPIFVRSSATDERGGSGIYDSEVFLPTGNQQDDLTRLEWAEKIVYSSCLNDQAIHHRERLGANEDGGMSVLIQPVVGDRFDNHFMPALSGVLTTINGYPVLRLVMGLGTKAVEMDKAIVLKEEKVDAKKATDNLSFLKEMHVIDLGTGGLVNVPVTDEFIEVATSQTGKLSSLLEEWRAGFEKGEPFYLEFAITPGEEKPVILQAAPDEMGELEFELGRPEGLVACEGNDVVNMGSRKGRGILWVGRNGFSREELKRVEVFNERNKDFLIVVVDTLFSGVGDRSSPIQMQHFSNAAGVVEMQHIREEVSFPGIIPRTVNHTEGRGGAHFTEICKREDILFLGVVSKSPSNDLAKLLGRPTEYLSEFTEFWDVDYKISNGKIDGRVEILGDVSRPEYSSGEIDQWADEFWHLGGVLDDSRTRTLSNDFYMACHILTDISDAPLAGFDPFDVSRIDIGEGVKEVIKILETVIKNIDETDSYAVFEYEARYVDEFRLENYLKKLLEKVRSKL